MPELNPILIRDLRSRMRGARAYILLTIYLTILAGVSLLLYVAIAGSVGSDLNAGREIGRALFFTIATVALIEVCLITPVLTSGSIAGEKERQTYDLLIASLLTPWQIVWGKLASALAFALLLILAVVPVMSLAFLFGGVGLTEVLIAIVGLVATAILYAAIGLFWSALMQSSLGATSFAIGTVIVILLGIPFLIVIVTLILEPSALSRLLESLWFIYISRLFISLHPFIALGTTASQLSSGESPFFEVVRTGTANVVVLSPWLLYAILSLIATVILVASSVRHIHPVQPESARRRRARSQDRQDVLGERVSKR
ncbi:MAG: ABC transporter permease [Roseiflexus sp.]|jgi:ABC-type transport system involved in multi-copper enzyme maturation permease subunit|nr:ABC transporter permease [Roseiflexus sp.]MBO9363356.1 ABC transporter permease [Roseiflexus sp.]MBO9380986.1 ABC transporter permease [Roseiflexus sp.]MBO9387849.1 ABC transporter permease [Roseiflexus sp.]